MKHFIDAFAKNKAPYIIEEVGFYGKEVKRYLPEAYTDLYMIRSDKTNQLCRYVIQTDEGYESLYGYYGIKSSSKAPIDKVYKVLEKMTSEDRVNFAKQVFTERFDSENDALDFLGEYNYSKYRITEPEKFALCNKCLGSVVYAIVNNK